MAGKWPNTLASIWPFVQALFFFYFELAILENLPCLHISQFSAL